MRARTSRKDYAAPNLFAELLQAIVDPLVDRARQIGDLLILALQDDDESWVFAPSDGQRLRAGYSLIFMGSSDARVTLEGLTQAAS